MCVHDAGCLLGGVIVQLGCDEEAEVINSGRNAGNTMMEIGNFLALLLGHKKLY